MILLNGKLVGAATAMISPLGEGFQFGAGVFTTMRVSGGAPEFFRAHWERLMRDARAVGLEAATSAEVLRERCMACIAANRIVSGGIKIIWFAETDGRLGEIISQRPHPYTAAGIARGFRLMSMACEPRAARELSRHKTLNYLEHLRAKRAAVKAGFDEALWVDDRGNVLEGATTNLFAVIEGRLVTPHEDAGLLPGVARGVVMGLEPWAQQLKSASKEPLTREMLGGATELFLTNSLMGVVAVSAWDERSYSLERNPVTRSVAADFAAAAERSREAEV